MNTTNIVKFTMKNREMILQEGDKTFPSLDAVLSWIGTRAMAEIKKGNTVLLKPGSMHWRENDRSHDYTWNTGETGVGKTHQRVVMPKTNGVCTKCDGTGKWVGTYNPNVVRECFACKGKGVIGGTTQKPVVKKDELKVANLTLDPRDEAFLTREMHYGTNEPVQEKVIVSCTELDENDPFTE